MFTFLSVIKGVGNKSGKVRTITRHFTADTFGGALKATRECSRANFELGATIVSITNTDVPEPELVNA